MARTRLTKEERLAYKREYYRKWRVLNRDKTIKAAADWRKRNPSKSKEISNSWKKRNPAAHAALNMKRKAAKLQRTVPWADLDLIQEFYDEATRLTKETGKLYHVDHVIPLQGRLVSGLHVHNNLQVILAVDNMSKGNRMYQFIPTILNNDEEIIPWLSN